MKDLSALSVRLPVELKDWLDTRADENGRSMNSEIVQILKAVQAEGQPRKRRQQAA